MSRTMLATVALAGLVAGAAALGSAADAAPSRTAPAHASAHTIGRVAFNIGGSDDTHEAAVLHGAITDGGRDDGSNDGYDVLHLSKGSMRLNHPDKDSRYSQKANPKTCYVAFTLTGTFTVDHGTAAYRGVTGKGTYKGTGYAIARRTASGACNFQVEPQAEVFTISGVGMLSR